MAALRRRLRSGARFAGFCLLTLAEYGTWKTGNLFLGLQRSAAERRRHWQSRCMKRWARRVLRLVGARVTVQGTPPSPPYLLACNHLGYFDIVVLASQCEWARFVAKRDVQSWPLLGPLVSSMGTIFIDRGRKQDLLRVNRDFEGHLTAGEGILLFPEGTSSDGARVLPLKPSLLQYPARAGRDVHSAAIAYRTRPGEPPAGERVCWWGDMDFLGHFLRLLAMPGFDATVVFCKTSRRQHDRKILAQTLQQDIQNALDNATGTGEETP